MQAKASDPHSEHHCVLGMGPDGPNLPVLVPVPGRGPVRKLRCSSDMLGDCSKVPGLGLEPGSGGPWGAALGWGLVQAGLFLPARSPGLGTELADRGCFLGEWTTGCGKMAGSAGEGFLPAWVALLSPVRALRAALSSWLASSSSSIVWSRRRWS